MYSYTTTVRALTSIQYYRKKKKLFSFLLPETFFFMCSYLTVTCDPVSLNTNTHLLNNIYLLHCSCFSTGIYHSNSKPHMYQNTTKDSCFRKSHISPTIMYLYKIQKRKILRSPAESQVEKNGTSNCDILRNKRMYDHK